MNDGHDSLILKFPIGKIFFSIGIFHDEGGGNGL